MRINGRDRIYRDDIRYRDRFLPVYASANPPTLEHAFFDKIALTFFAYDLTFPDRPSYRRFRENFDQLGIVARGTNTYAPKFLKKWLFEGKLRLESNGRTKSELDGPVGWHYKIRYELSLNPTRFIHHCYVRYGEEGMKLSALRKIRPEQLLLKQEIPFEQKSVDLNDNYIPKQLFKKLGKLEPYLQLYVESVMALLNTAIERSYMGECFSIKEQRDWQLNHCECYWDLATRDALSFVHGMWPHFKRAFFEADKRSYSVDERHRRLSGWTTADPIQGVLNNAPALRANLGPEHLNLSLYAKGYERVRFEFRYTETVRRFFDNAANRRRVPDTLDGLYIMLGMVKQNAHKRFLKIHKSFPDAGYSSERADFVTFADFLTVLSKLHQRHKAETTLRNLLATLAANQRFVVIVGSKDEKLLEALRMEHVVRQSKALLVNPRGQRVYYLNPRYANVMKAFCEILIN